MPNAWGHWLRDRLEDEGVGTSLFELIEGAQTPVAAVAIDDHGEASYAIYVGSARWVFGA